MAGIAGERLFALDERVEAFCKTLERIDHLTHLEVGVVLERIEIDIERMTLPEIEMLQVVGEPLERRQRPT